MFIPAHKKSYNQTTTTTTTTTTTARSFTLAMQSQPSKLLLKTLLILQWIGTAPAFTVETYRNKPLAGFACRKPSLSSSMARDGLFDLDVGDALTPLKRNAELINVQSSTTLENRLLVGEPPVASIASSSKTTTEMNTMLQRIQRRLDTAEDKFDIHKISSSIFVLSSTIMFATGINNGFSETPDFLQVPTWLCLLSSWVQGITSIDMARKYRANDPVMQSGFISMALNLLNSSWTFLYFSPFAPEAFDSFLIGNGVIALFFLPNAVRGAEELLNLSLMMDHRVLRSKEKGQDLGRVGDIFSYGSVAMINFFLGALGFLFFLDPAHDRSWIMDAVNNPWILSSKPGVIESFAAHNYYSFLVVTLSAAYQALALTLRDKKLISKSSEQLIIATLNALILASSALTVGLL